MRKLGRMGEDSFSLISSAAGFVVNRVQVDETGWDFLVEFESSPQNIPLDMQDGPIQAKVQVKATEHRADGVQISLSNLHRLAKDPLPAFVCLMVFHGKDEVQEIYLVHVDKPLVSRILKAVRKHEANGIVELHRRSLQLKFPPSAKLGTTSASDLSKAITHFVGSSLSAYTERKLNELKDIGYENGRYVMRCIFDPEPFQKLTEAYLGHDVAIDVCEISHYTNRFGIELPETGRKAERAKLRIKPNPHEDVLVSFSNDEFSISQTFVCKMYVASLNPISKLKFRVISSFFDFTLDFEIHRVHFSLTADEDTEATASDFAKWFKVVRVIATRDVYVKVAPPSLPSIEFHMQANNAFEGIDEEYDATKSLTRIITELDLPVDHKYKLSDILICKQRIELLEKVLLARRGDYSVEFSPGKETNVIDIGAKAAGIIYLELRLPRHYIGLIFCICGMLGKKDARLFKITSHEAIIKHKWVSESRFPEKDDVQRIIEGIADEYKAIGIAVFRLGKL